MSFNITLVNFDGQEHKITCDGDTYILDSLEESGYTIPHLCRAGACGRCAAKIIDGKVDNSEQSYLTQEQIDKGFIQTCVSYPLSDCKILINQEKYL